MEKLNKKWGKLPVWAWILIAFAAILLSLWLRRNWIGDGNDVDDEAAPDEYGEEIAEYYEPAGDDFFTGAGYAEDYESGTYPSPVTEIPQPTPVNVIVKPGSTSQGGCRKPPKPPLPKRLRGRWEWRFHKFKNTKGRRWCGRWVLHRKGGK